MERNLYIIGTKIDDISLEEALIKIQEHLLTKDKGFIVTPNPEICLKAYQDKQLRRIIKNSLISIPDGFGLKIGARIFGQKLKNITTGVDLTYKLLELAEQNNYSVLFFEGIPKIGNKALKIINKKYPKLKIKCLNAGKVSDKGLAENKQLTAQINQFSPDIIFVNFGAPKQEYFIKNNLDKLNTKLLLGIGGSFDFISGRLKRAPKIMRKLGLEWLYRLIQEPQRITRIFNAVIVFPISCLRFLFGVKFLYRNNVAACIINKDKKILMARQANTDYWQFPQGGAKKAKSHTELEKEMFKELKQEVGTDKFKVLQMEKRCHKYVYPNANDPSIRFDPFRGQKQTLFLMQFTGTDQDIKLATNELAEWKWVDKDQLVNTFSELKKGLAKIALIKFKDYL